MTCEKTRTGSVTNHCGDTKTGEITVPIPIFSQARRVVTSSRHTVRLTLPRPLPGREGGLLPSPTRGTKACRYLRTLVVQASRLHPSLVVMQAVLLICLLTGGCGRGAGDRKSVALVAVEIEGEEDAIELSVEYMRERGVQVEELTEDEGVS